MHFDKATSRPRKYWHVDLKWISGILLFMVLNLLLVVYSLVVVTSEKVAINAMSIGIASAFSHKGLDDPSEINQFKKQFLNNPNKIIKPIPGLPITVKGKDINTLSPREVRIYIFRQIAEPIYNGEAEKYMVSTGKNQKKKTPEEELGLLAYINKENHENLKQILVVLELITLGLFIPLIYFSHGFGRITSPGVVLSLLSLPGTILFNLAKMALINGSSISPPSTKGGMEVLIYTAKNVLPPIIDEVAKIYTTVLVIGLVFLLTSLLGKIVWFGYSRYKRKVSKIDITS